MAACAQSDVPSSMLAVFAAPDQVAKLLQQHALDLVIANENAPAQCVLSGPIAEIGRAARAFFRREDHDPQLGRRGGLSQSVCGVRRVAAVGNRFPRLRLPLRGYRSSPMRRLRSIPSRPRKPGSCSPASLRGRSDLWPRSRPCIAAVPGRFSRWDPARRLSAMVAAILEGRAHQTVAVDASGGEGDDANLADLASVLARLAALGYPVNLSRWDEGFEVKTLASPRSRLSVKVCGANATTPRFHGPGKATARATEIRLRRMVPPQPRSPCSRPRTAVVDGPLGNGPNTLPQHAAARIPQGVPPTPTCPPSGP